MKIFRAKPLILACDDSLRALQETVAKQHELASRLAELQAKRAAISERAADEERELRVQKMLRTGELVETTDAAAREARQRDEAMRDSLRAVDADVAVVSEALARVSVIAERQEAEHKQCHDKMLRAVEEEIYESFADELQRFCARVAEPFYLMQAALRRHGLDRDLLYGRGMHFLVNWEGYNFTAKPNELTKHPLKLDVDGGAEGVLRRFIAESRSTGS